MKKTLLLSTLVALLAACSKGPGNDISASKNESKESPNFGSATDIASVDGKKPNATEPNAADNGLGGPVQRESGNYQQQPHPGQASDEELAKQIKVALTTGSMGTTGMIAEDQLAPIDVQVKEGAVTLSGPAANEKEKESITKQVSRMKGVRGVVNNMAVGGRNVDHKPLKPLVPRNLEGSKQNSL
jgi:hypothetical protein